MKSILSFYLLFAFFMNVAIGQEKPFQPFIPPVSYEIAGKRADEILSKMTIEEKAALTSGNDMVFGKGLERFGIPRFLLTDATAGIHIFHKANNLLPKSTAFPNPLALTATWNPALARQYATSIGEECRAGNIGVLLGPGMNIYRISQNGRNFEYFGEDPFLAARMIENYVVGMQSTGTVTTLKHFVCNETEFHRRTTNSKVDERTLHEIYLPAFKAGVDAGAMAVMTSYNQLNGEWAGQSDYVINNILRKQLGFKWLVMSDWESVWDAGKIISSGLDLEMPGNKVLKNDSLKTLKEGKVTEEQIHRMAKSILRTYIAMGMFDRPTQDTKYLQNYPEHEKTALQTARESVVLLKNEKNILPLDLVKIKKIIVTGDYVEKLAKGGGSAEVDGFDNITMLTALKTEFGKKIEYIKNPTESQLKTADVVLVSVGTFDNEAWDRSFSFPDTTNQKVIRAAQLNPNTVVIVNSGGGVQLTNWNHKVAAILYAWYPGQNGNTALAEILSGKTNPSGKLPVTLEKKFEDSPGYLYIPADEKLYSGWNDDGNMKLPINTIEYKEGVFVGYRWYEAKKIAPLYVYGHGLSYTSFEYSNLKLPALLKKGQPVTVEFTLKNTGKKDGAEVAQLYIHDVKSSLARPVKELKGFRKVFLKAGESQNVTITLTEKDFSYWDTSRRDWYAEPGEFEIMLGTSSSAIKLIQKTVLE